jgi:hypothetical protein
MNTKQLLFLGGLFFTILLVSFLYLQLPLSTFIDVIFTITMVIGIPAIIAGFAVLIYETYKYLGS